MFDGYPQAIRDIMNTMFVVDGEPVRPLKKNLKPVAGANRSCQYGPRCDGSDEGIMSVQQITVNVDGYLALNKYEVDEANAHIELVEDPSDEEFDKLVMVCPAALYKREPDGTTSFDYAGCLECGTCRIACGDTIIARWENPQPTMGVEYRFG